MQITPEYLKISKDLHSKWKPHEGQKAIISELVAGKQHLFIQCGRKFGKSELVIYLLWRYALLNPGSACYYLAPFMKQAKEIIWASRRIQGFCNEEYIESIDNTELRIRFKNGSFIKVDGSDNFEAYRGITPNFVVYDEFKDFRPEFHEAMAPNLAAKNAPLVIIGTPPKPRARNYKQYINIAEEFRQDVSSFWIERTSYDNPHISKEWLDKERDRLIARGDKNVWELEYLAKIVGGGRNSIFPMFNKETHVKDLGVLFKKQSKRDLGMWDFYIVARPSATTCFAALLCAIHKYNKSIKILSEIYEEDKGSLSSQKIGIRLAKTRAAVSNTNHWTLACTEDGKWFSDEMLTLFDVYFSPVKTKGEEGISALKEIFDRKLLQIDSSCTKLIWEIENYVLDDRNNLPKEYNYAIECLKVLISTAGYSPLEVIEIKEKEPMESKNRYRQPIFDADMDDVEETWTQFSNTFFK
jgi:hypothetical protein